MITVNGKKDFADKIVAVSVKPKYSPRLADFVSAADKPTTKCRVTITTSIDLTEQDLNKLDFYGIFFDPNIESFEITVDSLDALAELSIVQTIDLAS